jgi:hypothetical protein
MLALRKEHKIFVTWKLRKALNINNSDGSKTVCA